MSVPLATSAELRLRPGGRIDLSDGLLGVARADWVSAKRVSGAVPEAESDPGEIYVAVPRGYADLTIAQLVVTAPRESTEFAAAELRFTDAEPVRWDQRGNAVVNDGVAAWFSQSARLRYADSEAFPLDRTDNEGRAGTSVTATWDTPCFYLDDAPREPGQVHDAVLLHTNAGDAGGIRQYIGYSADGTPAAAVLLALNLEDFDLPVAPR